MTEKKKFINNKLRKLKPESIVDRDKPVDKVDMFFLVLAFIHNDIKGLAYFGKWLEDNYEFPKGDISTHTGEYNGIKGQSIKYFASALNEIVELLKRNKAIFKEEMFIRCYMGLSNHDKNIWDLLLEVAGIKEVDDSKKDLETFRNLLIQIRSNVSFHYYESGKNLIKGFRRHFYNEKSPGLNQPAYYSVLTRDFWKTRFYYADAALEGYLFDITEDNLLTKDVVDAIYNFSLRASKVFVGLLEEYYKYKPQV